MNYEYFDGWHRYYREPVGPLTEQEAKYRASKGIGYCVVVRRGDPSFQSFIEVNEGYLGVNFLDEEKRVYLTYGFEEVDDDRLFLKQAIFSEFRGTSDEPQRTTAYYFDKSGSIAIERSETPFEESTVQEGHCDVTDNWESKPQFGVYDALLRQERGGF